MREKIKLESTADTGHYYVTTKNKTNTPDKLEFKKFRVDAVAPYLGEIDMLLVMSVHTGFGGQPFIPEVLDKVRAARRLIAGRR